MINSEYDIYKRKLNLIGFSFIYISEFILEFEFIIKFLNSDTRFINLVAGSAHTEGVIYFLKRLKFNSNLTDEKLKVKVSKRVNHEKEKLENDCIYNNIDEITELF